MLQNQLVSIVRHLWRYKYFTFLNIAGLTIGFLAYLLISQYVRFERSYDDFHKNANNIYRIQYNMVQNGITTVECAAAVPAVGPTLKENYSQVKDYVRLFPLYMVLTYDDPDQRRIAFREEKVQFTEPSLFDVFDFELIRGDESTALEGVNKIVVSERAAKKYFGDNNPIGKQLEWSTWDGIRLLEVTGVMANLPDNSHIKFDICVSLDTYHSLTNNSSATSWTWYDFNTYVLLNEGASPSDFNDKFKSYLSEVRADHWAQYNYYQEFIFQPLRSIHLTSKLTQESEPQDQGDDKSVNFLFYAAFVLVLITWINYINMSSVRLIDTAADVGIRKTLGSGNGWFYIRFFLESFIVMFLSLVLAIAFLYFVWGAFSNMVGKPLPEAYLTSQPFIIELGILLFIGITLCSLYPIMIAYRINPTDALKGKLEMKRANFVRKGFLFFQFVLSTVILIVAYTAYEQHELMREKDLGVQLENILILDGPEVIDTLYDSKIEAFKYEINQLAGVGSFSTSFSIPGERIFWTRGIRRTDVSGKNNITVYNVGIDEDYVETYDLQLLAGRNFMAGSDADYSTVIINRALSESLEFETPEEAVGVKVRLGRDTLSILGVIEDYHQMAVIDDIEPISFIFSSELAFYSVRLEDATSTEILADIESLYTEYFPGNPFSYFFLDDHYNKQYDQTQRFIYVFGLFSILAIFISYLGLAGLVSYMTARRTKEIGLRKVLGTSNAALISLFATSFLWILIPSSVVGWIVSWPLADWWLNSFPYRLSLNPIYFLLISMGITVFVVAAVVLNTLKVSAIKPAEALRHE